MKLIPGNELTASQRQDVLASFVHRWTHENARQTYRGKCPGCEQAKRSDGQIRTGPKNERVWTVGEWHAYHVPLTSDVEWLRTHAFYVTNSGEVSNRHHHCEPIAMATA